MQKRIKELSDVDHGSITIGGSSLASYLLLSEICSEFYKEHPQIKVTLDIGNVGNSGVLWEKLGNKEIDILVTYAENYTKHRIEPIFEERLVIAMHRSMPGAENLQHLTLTRDEILTKSYAPDREIEDLSIFSDVEFLGFARKSDTEQRMAKMLGSYKSSRYKIQNARHSEMHYNLMCAGVGAVLTTTLAIEQKPKDENILFFLPKSEDSHRTTFLAYHPFAESNQLLKAFVAIAKRIFS
jgi:DNA-binding transcriptional LysR family regulator